MNAFYKGLRRIIIMSVPNIYCQISYCKYSMLFYDSYTTSNASKLICIKIRRFTKSVLFTKAAFLDLICIYCKIELTKKHVITSCNIFFFNIHIIFFLFYRYHIIQFCDFIIWSDFIKMKLYLKGDNSDLLQLLLTIDLLV